MGRRDNPDVHRKSRPPHPVRHAAFQHAQQAGLRRKRHFAYFIQKNCASVRHFKIAGTEVHSSGEGPFFVPEQFAVQ